MRVFRLMVMTPSINLTSITFLACLFCLTTLNAQIARDEVMIPLYNDSGINIHGAHRFVNIAGIHGLHVTSLKTKAFVETDLLGAEKGTLSFWMSPLEDIDKSAWLNKPLVYPFLSDAFPPAQVESCNFSFFYDGSGYPRIIAGFTDGNFWQQMDYGISPYVYAETLPLQRNQWYHFAITWDKAGEKLFMYINGMHVGHHLSAKKFKRANNRLYVGNPLMVISRLKIQNKIFNGDEVKREYLSMRPASNTLADSTIQSLVVPQVKPPINIQLDDTWQKVYECSFTKKEELKDWIFQTGDQFRDQFTLDITGDGLLWKTPETIHTETRAYLWCPVILEGDHYVEFEFQLLSPDGLALMMICANGLFGEDIIADHGLKKSGSMDDMNANYRNYHWEYMRRVEAMRTDVETQYLNKNPWGKSLYSGCMPRFEQNKWIKIAFIKVGNRICGSIDGKTVFDVVDDPSDNNGPVFNSGRVILRQMYKTSMRYRNFVAYQRKAEGSIKKGFVRY